MELANKNILIVGLGRTGFAAAKFANSRGATVTVTDIANEQELGSYAQTAREMGIKIELGQHRNKTFETADLILLSPGVSHTIRPIKKAKDKGITVLGEIEFAFKFIREPIIAVTGTNGKTTTTTLLGNMLRNSGFKTFVGGNIGNPLIGYVNKGEKAEIVVAEVSSFQLDTIDSFKPKVGVLLNITEDHLDRYPNFQAYAKAKARIFENQQKNDTAVLNGSDPLVCSVCKNIKSRKLLFYDHNDIQIGTNEGAVLNNKRIIINTKEKGKRTLDLSSTSLLGRHNIENAAAASIAALAAGGKLQSVQTALNKFTGLPHRLEYVTTINEVQYYNDSKATNVHSAMKALETFSKPVILIMGGRDKGSNFQLLEDLMREHVKELIIMGEAKKDIKSALGHITPTKVATTMEDAVYQAYLTAKPGDVVLLSPACSSFDMYSNYAERGEVFYELVNHLS